MIGILLAIVAAVLAVVGWMQVLDGRNVLGLALIVVAFLTGPGTYSLIRNRRLLTAHRSGGAVTDD